MGEQEDKIDFEEAAENSNDVALFNSISQYDSPSIHSSDPPSNEYFNYSSHGSKYTDNVGGDDAQSPGSSIWMKNDDVWDLMWGRIDENTDNDNRSYGIKSGENGGLNDLQSQVGKMGGVGKMGWKNMRIGLRNETETCDHKELLPDFSHGRTKFAKLLHILFLCYVSFVLLLKYMQYPSCKQVQYCVVSIILILLSWKQVLGVSSWICWMLLISH